MMGRENKLPAENAVAREKLGALRLYLAKLEQEMRAYIAEHQA